MRHQTRQYTTIEIIRENKIYRIYRKKKKEEWLLLLID